MNKVFRAERGKISSYQLFCILFISRIVVTLSDIQTVSVGSFSTDFLLSVAISFLITAVLSLPVILCIEKYKNPLSIKWLSLIYAFYYIFVCSVNISRFSSFASSRLHPQTHELFFVVIIVLAVCYASSLGIEGLGRFGFFCFFILLIAMVTVCVFNYDNFHFINFYPSYENTNNAIILNGFILSSNTVEPVALLALCGRSKINCNDVKKPYIAAISISYATIFFLLMMCVGVMGGSSTVQSYPVFTLFQMASMDSFSRLDIIHTSFWIFGLFLKCALLIYCASIMIKKFNHKIKSAAAGLCCLIICVLFIRLLGNSLSEIPVEAGLVLWILFCFIIPLLSLMFTKKQTGEELLEKF